MIDHLKFQTWMMQNMPSPEYKFRDSWLETYVFFRDRILPMILDNMSDHQIQTDAYGLLDMDEYTDALNKIHDIAGSHVSKSLKHPVILIHVPDTIQMVLRWNHYNWEFMVDSKYPLRVPEQFHHHAYEHCFCEGIPESFIIKDQYDPSENNKRFYFKCEDTYELYAILVTFCDSISYGKLVSKKYRRKSRKSNV